MQRSTIKRHWIIFLLLLLFGIIGVVSTYTHLSFTDDEWFHIACGMEWWEKGIYTIQPLHPPLTRIMDAAVLYWSGVYPPNFEGATSEYIRNVYMQYLVFARVGTLPFYILSCVTVFLWSRELFGSASALLSLALYVTLSTVTAHGALATTDMGYTAMLILALMASVRWIETITLRSCVFMGVSIGLMIGSKFSGLVQWPAAMTAIIAAQTIINHSKHGKNWLSSFPIKKAHFVSLIYVVPVMAFTLGLIYRFSFLQFIGGIYMAAFLNDSGYSVWLFEPLHNQGVWYFFPVVFLFKTPLSFFATAIISNVRIVRELPDNARIDRLFPLLAAVAILAVSMTSNINLGVRHVLALYPLLAIPGGYAIMWLWQGARWKRGIAIILCVWQLFGFAKAYPEHIAYFNELAGEHPERITLDSDYDWGQAMILMDEALQKHDVKSVYLCARKDTYWNAAIVSHAEVLLCPDTPVSGWIAVARAFRLQSPNNFTWLNGYEAVQSVGKTMDLYYIPPK